MCLCCSLCAGCWERSRAGGHPVNICGVKDRQQWGWGSSGIQDFFLKQSVGLADELDVECKGKEGIRVTSGFWFEQLSGWEYHSLRLKNLGE